MIGLDEPIVVNPDAAVLILRVVLGVAMILHGYPKVLGEGRKQTVEFMKSMGVPPVVTQLTSLLEFAGGIAVAVGFLTAPIAILFALEMAATTVLSKRKLGKKYVLGYELDIAYLGVALATALLGGGTIALDALL